jgi:hypothetical protein
MAFVLPDAVWETTTTTGTGALTLAGAVSNQRAFSSQMSNADTTYYSMWDGTDYEEGLGTYTSAGNTLTRTTVYRSTNGGAAVNWGAGTKQVVAAMLGIAMQSLMTPTATGFPNRSAANTWSYYTTVGSGTAVALATDPVFTNSWGLNSDIVYDYETTNTAGIHTDDSDAHTTGNGLIEKWYTYFTDSSNYEAWQLSAAIGSGDFQISHVRAGTYSGNTRGLRLNATSTIILTGDAGIQLVSPLVAGTTTYAPVVMSSGTNLTTASAGAFEYDGTVHYKTNNASNRGLSPAIQYILNNGNTRTLTSQTAAQPAFNSPAGGALTLPTGLYEFEGYFELSSMSATSGSFGFNLGGTATKTQHWTSTALKTAAGAAGATAQTTHNTSNANVTLITANTTTSGWFYVRGTFQITATGTVIPQISLGVAAAAVVSALSYFKVQQIANTTTRSIGNWA